MLPAGGVSTHERATVAHVEAGLRVYDTPLQGFIEDFFEFFAVPWFAGKRARQALHPGFSPGTVTGLVFAHFCVAGNAYRVTAIMGP